MSAYLLLIVSNCFVNNIVLTQFLGLCPFVGVSKKIETAIGMGLATLFVLTLSASLAWIVDHFLLTPFSVIYLRPLIFIFVIAAVVQLIELLLRAFNPLLYRLLGLFLPLITSNCAVLGVALLNLRQHHTFFQSILYGFSAALGFVLVMLLLTTIRERLIAANTPAAFRGTPITLITIGIIALAFMGFNGIVNV